MSDYLTYNQESVSSLKYELEDLLNFVKSSCSIFSSIPKHQLEVASNHGVFQARKLLSTLNETRRRLNNHVLVNDNLIHNSLSITQCFEFLEDKISSLLNAFSPLKNFVNFITFSGIDQIDKTNQILDEVNNKVSCLVQEFDGVVALILANIVLWGDLVSNNANLSENVIRSDIIATKHREIKGFYEMNVWQLIKQNPDIKRKGVMLGFNGEYWNPEKQMQCTLYAAMRRTMIGKPLPQNGPWGNAGSWAISARRAGLNVDRIPNVGDVFVQGEGYYGHVGIVEKVNPDGSILISEANYGYNGAFHTRTITKAKYSGWQFIS